MPKSGGFLDKGDVVDGKFVSDGMVSCGIMLS